MMEYFTEPMPVERTLTVFNYSDEDEIDGKESDTFNEDKVLRTRVTINRDLVQFVIGSENAYRMVNGIELRKVNVILTTGNNLELVLSVLDLTTLERAVGFYMLPGAE